MRREWPRVASIPRNIVLVYIPSTRWRTGDGSRWVDRKRLEKERETMSFLHYFLYLSRNLEFSLRMTSILHSAYCLRHKHGRPPKETRGMKQELETVISLAVQTMFCKRFHLHVQGKTTLIPPTYVRHNQLRDSREFIRRQVRVEGARQNTWVYN